MTQENDPSPSLRGGDQLDGSVLETTARLDKTVRDCVHSLVIAERLKARGRWQDKWDGELTATREKLATTLRERDGLDETICRAAVALALPNDGERERVTPRPDYLSP